MSRYDLRFAARHPLKWMKHWWLHLAVATMFCILATVWTAPQFERVLQPNLWPIGAGALAFGVVLSALAPWERRLQTVVAAALITFGILRAIALLEVAVGEPRLLPIAISLAVHALGISSLGVIWPDWTTACAGNATVEAGSDDRGDRGA